MSVINFINSLPGISGWVILFELVMSLVAFILYGVDKRKAVKGAYRISEACLISLAVFGGALGAFLAMALFRHKTKHVKFTLTVPLLSVVWLVITAKSFFL